MKDRYLQLYYEERDSQTNWRSAEATVLLDAGTRCWFRCPTCNRRAGTLFIVGPPFGCRVCMRLTYQSQRQSAEARITTRAIRLRHRLYGTGDAFIDGLSEEEFDEEFEDELDELLGDDDPDELFDDDLDQVLEEDDVD